MFVQINIFDLGIGVLLVAFLLKGLKNGLFLELVYIGGFFIALVATLRYLNTTTRWVNRLIELTPHMSSITAFALSFAVLMVLYQFVVMFIQKNTKVTVEPWVDRVGGILFGSLKGATVISLLCLMIMLFPLSTSAEEAEMESASFRFMKKVAPQVYAVVKRVIPGSPDFSQVVDDTFLGNFNLSELDSYSKRMVQEFGSDKAQEQLRAANP